MQSKSSGRGSVLRGRFSAPMALRAQRGLTLVELMITVAVAGILLVIAVPNFRTAILSNQLTSSANDVVTALNVAKLEAIKGNNYAAFCSDSASINTTDTLGTACNGTQGGPGAVFFTSTTANGSTAVPVRTAMIGVNKSVQLSSSMQAVRFNGDGIGMGVGSTAPLTNIIADICTSSLSSNNHRLVTLTAGSVIVTCNATATCPGGTVSACK